MASFVVSGFVSLFPLDLPNKCFNCDSIKIRTTSWSWMKFPLLCVSLQATIRVAAKSTSNVGCLFDFSPVNVCVVRCYAKHKRRFKSTQWRHFFLFYFGLHEKLSQDLLSPKLKKVKADLYRGKNRLMLRSLLIEGFSVKQHDEKSRLWKYCDDP